MRLTNSVLHILRKQAQDHHILNNLTYSETSFREIVCKNTETAYCREVRLAGDYVAAVAQPIARTVDKITAAVGKPTQLSGCGGCKKRREKLNLWHERLSSKRA